MSKLPSVSIIIVNFNGRHLLANCVPSVFSIDFPRHQYEVIVVDNNSTDDSVSFIKKNFPQVKLVVSDQNLGFTGGNLLGYTHATGEYIALLNSDTTVNKQWLKALVKAAEPPSIGIVSPKIRYATPFVELTINSLSVPKSALNHGIDHSPVGVIVEEIFPEDGVGKNLIWYKSGWYDKQSTEITFRRTKGIATAYLPYPLEKKSLSYTITLHGQQVDERSTTPVEIKLADKVIYRGVLRSRQVEQVQFSVHRSAILRHLHWLIQNAGNIVLTSAHSKDRGSVLIFQDQELKEFYEEDSDYFDQPTELLSMCGASCLIKRAVIDEIAFFDGYYFMYYEDVEFSLRAWKAGWKIQYQPLAVVYHQHRASTGTSETAFFLEHVERNHIALALTHFSLWTAMIETFWLFTRFSFNAIMYFLFQLRDNPERTQHWGAKFLGRGNALIYIFRSLPRLLSQRFKLQRLWRYDQTLLKRMMY